MSPPRFRRLLAKYLGPDEERWNAWFVDTIARIDDPDGRLIRLDPDERLHQQRLLLPDRPRPRLAGIGKRPPVSAFGRAFR
jgi:hypothetical protein